MPRVDVGDGVTLAYRDEGAGAPLVLIHGITEDLRAWDELVPELAQNARVLRVDLPGHGASSPLPEYTAASLAAPLAGFVRALGLDRPRVIGHSLGGLLATLLGALVPVRSIVNVDQSLRLGPFIELVRSIAPRLAGRGLDARRRLRPLPREHVVRGAARLHPSPDLGRLGRRIRSQTVIDRESRHAPAARAGPFPGEQAQRHAVGAARDRHRDVRFRLERPERRHGAGEFLGSDAARCLGRGADRAQHSSRRRSRVATCFTEVGACGKRR